MTSIFFAKVFARVLGKQPLVEVSEKLDGGLRDLLGIIFVGEYRLQALLYTYTHSRIVFFKCISGKGFHTLEV